MSDRHRYTTSLTWTGDTGPGYGSYDRTHRIRIEGKVELVLAADPMFLGDPSLHNPEDLLVAALSSCHLLTYLALCARARIAVLSYRDEATGSLMLTREGGGHFTDVVLRPHVVVSDATMVEKARELHSAAHKYCFIAGSVNFPVRTEATVQAAG